jgi:hypothetical protein
MLHAGSRLSFQHQQIRLLPSQFLLDEKQRIAGLDRHRRSALAQPHCRDEPGQRLLWFLRNWGTGLPSFLAAERGRDARNVILETSIVCVKKLEARLGEEGCRKLQSRRRGAREIERDEDSSVRGLVRIADDKKRPLDVLQQTPDGGGGNVPTLVSTGHDKIDAMGVRAGCNGPGGFSNADVDAARQVAAPQPPARLGLEMALGSRALLFDDPGRQPAVDDVQDDHVAAPLEREPGSPHEGNF